MVPENDFLGFDYIASSLSSECRYNVVFMVVTYFVPIMLMGYAYLRVGIELWGSQSIGECTQRQLQNIQSKRRVSVPFRLVPRCSALFLLMRINSS